MNTQGYYTKKAKYYDLINAHKLEEAEEEVRFFRRQLLRLNKSARTVLDLGCGTGRLSMPLSRLGFYVTGIDNSKEMLALAKKKASTHISNPKFKMANFLTYVPHRKFDCAVCCDASLATLLSKRTLVKALRRINADLKEGGVFFYDIWNYAEYTGWMPASHRSAKIDGIEINLERRTNVDSNGMYRFTDRMHINENGKRSTMVTTYTSMVWKLKDWDSMFKQAGFRTVKRYSNLKHIRHLHGVPDKIYFVAVK